MFSLYTKKAGFTLVEMLVVMGIIALLIGMVMPAIQGLTGSGTTNYAITELTGTLEMARTYAMSNHTYVRVGFATVPVQTGVALPSIAVIAIAPADGSLTNDTAQAMANGALWPSVGKPFILTNLWSFDALNAPVPDTSADLKPSGTDVAAFSRRVGGLGPQTFTSVIQFSPAGEARVLRAETARYIKLGFDQPLNANNTGAGRNRDPFLLRLSGINGGVDILRKEQLN